MAAPEERLFAVCKIPDTLVSKGGNDTVSTQEFGSVDYYAGGEWIGSLPVEAQAQPQPLCYRDYLSAVWRLFLGQ